VLGRIGIAWFVVAMLVWYVSIKGQWIIAAVILLGYWCLLSMVTISGFGGGDYTASASLNVWFDQTLLPGITYKNLPLDPEGILSNVNSIVNALIGAFIGRHMKNLQQRQTTLLLHLIIAGSLLLCLGYLWGIIFPINKSLWTSSFVLVTSGYSILLLSGFYAIIDVIKVQKWAVFFAVIGTNSILVYLGTSVVNWSYSANSLFGGLITTLSENWQPLMHITAVLFIQWVILYWLYRRNIFIKV
jgi:predicted acyltransferase